MIPVLSRRARSALAAVLDVALLARGKPLPARSLAARYDLAPRQFETVLQDLVRSGLLKGVRGPRGGYELARERRKISLGDIVRAIVDPPDQAASAATAGLDRVLAEASAAFMAHLDAVSVEDVTRRSELAEATSEGGTEGDFHI